MTLFTPPNIPRQLPSTIFGLSYRPSYEPEMSDNADCWAAALQALFPGQDNTKEVLDIVAQLARQRTAILEIGVQLFVPAVSFTPRLINNMAAGGTYVGVDIEPRKLVQPDDKNVSFIQCSSYEQKKVRTHLKELGITQLNMLVIDGDHSTNGCMNDWLYADLLAVGGLVLIHDCNSHPGPIALTAAIDRNIFEVTEPLKHAKDYGIAIGRRIA